MASQDEWVTAKEAREILGVSRARLYQLIDEGRLTPYQSELNKRFRFRRHDLEAIAQLRPAARPGKESAA